MALKNAFENLAVESKQLPDGHGVAVVNVVDIADSTDREYTSVATTVTSAGDTTLYTPSAGKRVRLHWIYAINDPVSTNSTKISLKIGTTTYYTVWAISKRQQFTGGVDEPLIINLASAGNVAVTAFVEEV